MICFCNNGIFSTGSSTPRSPRAIITASDSTIISLKFSSASGFSIFEIIFVLLFLASNLFLSPSKSFTLRTNDRATQSNFCSMINSRSSTSFSVSAGNEILVSGKFIPFFEERIPPIVTSTCTSLLARICFTFTSNLPSLIKIVLPIVTS